MTTRSYRRGIAALVRHLDLLNRSSLVARIGRRWSPRHFTEKRTVLDHCTYGRWLMAGVLGVRPRFLLRVLVSLLQKKPACKNSTDESLWRQLSDLFFHQTRPYRSPTMHGRYHIDEPAPVPLPMVCAVGIIVSIGASQVDGWHPRDSGKRDTGLGF